MAFSNTGLRTCFRYNEPNEFGNLIVIIDHTQKSGIQEIDVQFQFVIGAKLGCSADD